MRVGINLLYLLPGRVGGTEIYARRLIPALAAQHPDDEFVAFCGVEGAASLREERWPDNVRLHRLPVHSANKPLRSLAEQTLLPAALRRTGVDLVHSLGTSAPIAAPGVVKVVTLHDIIYEHYPETFPTVLRLGLKATIGPGGRAADRVITSSQATKGELVEHLRIPADRIDVVHLGYGRAATATPTAEAELRARYELADRRVVLCVSAAFRHKNLPRLIDAVPHLGDDVHLVLVGHAGRDMEALGEQARAAGFGDRVTLTGWISDEDLEGLYALAACCAYPSLHEGFGLPVLEAMARGVPLACANATSLPEVAGDAAELFDPRDDAAIAAAVRRVLDDPQHAAELVERGRRRVGDFTWERCADGCWAAYQRAFSATNR